MPQSSEIVWYLATADGPLTPKEVANGLSATRDSTQTLMYHMWDQGLLEREKHQEGRGPPTHKYSIKSRS